MAEEKMFYCQTEKVEKIFVRIDNEKAVIGTYQCTSCENVYGEAQLAYPDGEGGSLAKLLEDKAREGLLT